MIDILFKSWKELLYQQEKARLENIQKLINFYNGEHEQYLKSYIKLKNLDDFPFSQLNLTKRIINKISEVYKESPVRYINEKQNESYEKITKVKDAKMKLVERNANLLGIVGVRPFVNKLKKEKVFDYQIIRNFSCLLEGLEVKAVKYLIDDSGIEQRYEYWTDEIHTIIDANSNEISNNELLKYGIEDTGNKYGIMPFVWCRNGLVIDDFYNTGGNADDLINTNLHVDLMLSEMNHKFRYAAFNQPIITGIDADEPVHVGYDKAIILTNENAKFGTLNINHNFADDVAAIRSHIENINQMYGLRTQWAIEGNVSGFSLVIQNMDHRDNLKNMKEVCVTWENELYEMEKIVGKVEGVKVADGIFRTDFAELDMPLSLDEKIKKMQFELDNGLASRADYWRENNPDLTDEQIQEKLQKISDEVKFVKTSQQTEPTVSELFK